ncbi:MAG: methyl-accepting chemotaxis protein [bacterium]|nr:methyl-accepting chemotaxis protein [bacterium]MCM1374217.1 methyl-accepting chemotaxis protein [Muribaculum sp.]
MKKIFTKRLFIYMLAAFILTVTAVFALQTVITQRNNTANSQDKLQDVREKLVSNEENIERLTSNLSADNLAKTRAFADMLAVDRSIAGNSAKLNEIKDRLQVNELHIIDKDGIITSSTIDAYIGFDMKSGEQSNAFMVIVNDPSIEIVQEPQVNVAEGVVMQYIGVARSDAKGLVQVGVRPEVLEDMLSSTAIDVVLGDIDFGEKGYIYAIDAASGQILAHPNAALIGTSAAEAGFPAKLTGQGKARIDGVRGYYLAEEYEDKVIGTFMPANEYYAERSSQTLVVSLSMLVIFTVLLLLINHMVDSKIVQGINHITSSMKKIADGNFDTSVNETGNPEFIQLSDSINRMVESIGQNMKENELLLKQQESDMENNQMMIRNVKDACKELDAVSGENLANADHIYNGTGEQEKAVEDLKEIMSQLVRELNGSVDATVNVTEETGHTTEKIVQTQEQMKLLSDSMQRISEMSAAIEKIISEINSIAQQTNMLSLNASIEAARAGEMGKGFAVVAAQVGELAARSSQAAKETNELITNSINAVESGKRITDQTVKAFGVVVEDIEKANRDVLAITDMVRQNVDIVESAVGQIDRISNVVEENVQISQNTKQASSNVADITGKLLELVEQ